MDGYYRGNINDVKSSEVKIGNSKDAYIQWLITDRQEKSYAMRRFIIKPNGIIQMHYHDYYESLYIIRGKCIACVNNDSMELKSGDFIFIDSRFKHELINNGSEDLEFICVINYTKNMDIIPVNDECRDNVI
ncbi:MULTISPECIES: cupin domain-containing protein [Acidiplasma]|uniref:Cupin type-2 domain-containing protein n=1 Tax=Acidiplasma aeolicum TaxID=507754 RepID=A0A0Q0RG75_9ARCH|nr:MULTISPECIES: cupin domain-containing protein [Acidiplasma]KQB34112.1 hypothetical protein AOG54_05650 [Acidiplasma aeolicum]